MFSATANRKTVGQASHIWNIERVKNMILNDKLKIYVIDLHQIKFLHVWIEFLLASVRLKLLYWSSVLGFDHLT